MFDAVTTKNISKITLTTETTQYINRNDEEDARIFALKCRLIYLRILETMLQWLHFKNKLTLLSRIRICIELADF